jgi:hypothetical protein
VIFKLTLIEFTTGIEHIDPDFHSILGRVAATTYNVPSSRVAGCS